MKMPLPPTNRATGLTVADLFREQAKIHRDRVALQEGRDRWSYAELEDRVDRLVRFLLRNGVMRGDRIAVLSENRHEYIELELAAAKLGAIVACQNWRLSKDELSGCLALAEPRYA
jgi:acyl-CoA synthetase (AMP-forming)/AMP-acid ligase II